MEAGSAALRIDWPVYPRRAEHNTVAEGGIEDGPRLRAERVPIALGEADQRPPPHRSYCGVRKRADLSEESLAQLRERGRRLAETRRAA